MLKTDYRDAMCDGARKYRITTNPDGTSGIADMTVYTQEGDRFGCNDINATNQEVNALSKEMPELKKSVGDGKAMVAAAITRKKVSTEATATFEELASSVDRIRLGSGNAVESQVLKGVTFSNSDGLEHTGTMPDNPALNAVLNCGGSYTIPAGYHSGSGKVRASSLASQTGGVTADDGKVLSGSTYWRDGVKRTGNMPNRGGYQGTGNSSGNDAGNRRFYVNIPNGYYDNNAPVLLPWDWVKSWIGLTPDKIKKGVQIMDITGIAEGYVPSATDLYYRGNNPANWRNFMTDAGASFDAGQISFGQYDLATSLLTALRIICNPVSTVGYHYLNIEFSSFTLNSTKGSTKGSIKFSVGGAYAAVYGDRENYTGVITLDLGSVQAEGPATLFITTGINAQSGYVRGAIHRIWLS